MIYILYGVIVIRLCTRRKIGQSFCGGWGVGREGKKLKTEGNERSIFRWIKVPVEKIIIMSFCRSARTLLWCTNVRFIRLVNLSGGERGGERKRGAYQCTFGFSLL